MKVFVFSVPTLKGTKTYYLKHFENKSVIKNCRYAFTTPHYKSKITEKYFHLEVKPNACQKIWQTLCKFYPIQ